MAASSATPVVLKHVKKCFLFLTFLLLPLELSVSSGLSFFFFLEVFVFASCKSGWVKHLSDEDALPSPEAPPAQQAARSTASGQRGSQAAERLPGPRFPPVTARLGRPGQGCSAACRGARRLVPVKRISSVK